MKSYKQLVIFLCGAFVCSFILLGCIQVDDEGQLERSRRNNRNKPLHVHFVRAHNVNQSKSHNGHIWPSSERLETQDRISNQLKYNAPITKSRTILLVGDYTHNTKTLLKQCPRQRCIFTKYEHSFSKADAVVFFSGISQSYLRYKRPANQIWVLHTLESPYHFSFSDKNNVVNWTATYRRDSVLVTPYEKFIHFKNFTKLPIKPLKNFAAGKTKQVAWFVSKCVSTNGRQNYAKELSKYINVDIYGRCGKHKCPKEDQDKCFDLLRKQYKFYLSFENSNCKDYITEKFYVNALGNDVIPIVMGAYPDDYAAVAPSKSFIHVDHFKSPKELAAYLHKLDQNDELYSSYFHWKGTGEFINTQFWCRLCNMVHASVHTKHSMSYVDLNNWWNGPGICLQLSNHQGWVSWNSGIKWNDKSLLQSINILKNKNR